MIKEDKGEWNKSGKVIYLVMGLIIILSLRNYGIIFEYQDGFLQEPYFWYKDYRELLGRFVLGGMWLMLCYCLMYNVLKQAHKEMFINLCGWISVIYSVIFIVVLPGMLMGWLLVGQVGEITLSAGLLGMSFSLMLFYMLMRQAKVLDVTRGVKKKFVLPTVIIGVYWGLSTLSGINSIERYESVNGESFHVEWIDYLIVVVGIVLFIIFIINTFVDNKMAND